MVLIVPFFRGFRDKLPKVSQLTILLHKDFNHLTGGGQREGGFKVDMSHYEGKL